MPLPWLKLPVAYLNNPKIQALPSPVFRTFINCMLLAGQNESSNLGTLEDILFCTRSSEEDHIIGLTSSGFLSFDKKTNTYSVSNWEQYQGSSSTERVRKHRMKQTCNVTETLHETSDETDVTFKKRREEKRIDKNRIEKNYKFDGKVLKLVEKDYDAWKTEFPDIVDFEAELKKIDEYYEDDPKKLFYRARMWLRKENARAAEAAKKKKEGSTSSYYPGMV